jgi:hypothetical protein
MVISSTVINVGQRQAHINNTLLIIHGVNYAKLYYVFTPYIILSRITTGQADNCSVMLMTLTRKLM